MQKWSIKHMRKCSVLLAIKKMQIETIPRHLPHSLKWLSFLQGRIQLCAREQYSLYFFGKDHLSHHELNSNTRELPSNWSNSSSIRENNEVIPRWFPSSSGPLKGWLHSRVQVLGFLPNSSMFLPYHPAASPHLSLPFLFLFISIILTK